MSPTNERDAGFCSGSSENEEDLLDHLHNHQMRRVNSECSTSSQSPNTDVGSEDSSLGGDKFLPPTTPAPFSAPKNKRKSSEPIRVVSELSQCGPIKKRIKFENEKMLARAQAESMAKLMVPTANTTEPLLSPSDCGNPFRPWANLMQEHKPSPPPTFALDPAHSFKRHPGVTTLHRIPLDAPHTHVPKFEMPVQEEPISLVAKKSPIIPSNKSRPATSQGHPIEGGHSHKAIREMMKQKTVGAKPFDFRPEELRSVATAAHETSSSMALVSGSSRTPSLVDETSSTASSSFISPGTLNLSTKTHNSEGTASSSANDGEKGSRKDASQGAQRNYKNMTRERRIEANARERTRVHTISAAFDKLRHSIPAYSNSQKLSKLSVLRIACSYIMSLSRIADMDYSPDQSEPSIGECVDALTKTIQTEGKLRKKKDE